MYSQERTLIMDNFRITRGYGFKGFSKFKTRLNKGHNEQFRLLVDRIQKGGSPLIPFDELINTSRASFAAIESLKQGTWVKVSLT